MDVRRPFPGWVERDVHLVVEHDADEALVDRLDSREARDLHRWLHSMRERPTAHAHEEW